MRVNPQVEADIWTLWNLELRDTRRDYYNGYRAYWAEMEDESASIPNPNHIDSFNYKEWERGYTTAKFEHMNKEQVYE